MPKFTIDGKTLEVAPGTRVLEAALKHGIHIPHFCFHPALSAPANCRMCLVDVGLPKMKPDRTPELDAAGKPVIAMLPKLQTSCSTVVSEGMVVDTQGPRVKQGQHSVLEFILINHPLDCPICDKAGECMLQDNYFGWSREDSRIEPPDKIRKHKIVDLGPKIVLDTERCILCTRCIRFYDEVTKAPSLGIVNRGTFSELQVMPGRELNGTYDYNIVDICPVGALTSRDFRFRKRVWFLKKTAAICTHCATGCNMTVEEDEGRLWRQTPRLNPAVNGFWMCDAGRSAYHHTLDARRLTQPMRRGAGGTLEPASWNEALAFAAQKLRESGAGVAGFVSNRSTNEELFAFERLFAQALRGAPVASLETEVGILPLPPADGLLIRPDHNPNSRGVREIAASAGAWTGAEDLLSACAEKRIRTLLVMDPDLVGRSPNPAAAEHALASVENLIVIASHPSAATALAHVVLPGAAAQEKDGTYTRFDGRVQRSRAAIPPPGHARTELEILLGLAKMLGADFGWTSPRAAFTSLAQASKFFAGLTYDLIGPLGAVPAAAVAEQPASLV
ncbi:MAG: molybdopterin-dependent oxidoreductase [Planctomycetes bacterium]|nr:molybdopterin-dependent oxidoreductase [Planctomycetota bacterium]